MSPISFPKKLSLGMVIIYAIVAIGIIAGIVTCIAVSRNNYLATTMKITRSEGSVKIEKAGGGTKPGKKNGKLESGDALTTGVDGVVSVKMDDTKMITIQSSSRVVFTKNTNQEVLTLTKGALFFEVTEKLSGEEAFDIRTNAIKADIKGTSGYVYYDEEGRDSIVITDGVVVISATNPETGENKYAEVHGGQQLTVDLYSGRDEGSIDINVVEITENDLPEFVVKTLANDPDLMNRVCGYTGWNKETVMILADAIHAAESTKPSVEETLDTVPSETSATDTKATAETSAASETSETTAAETTAETEDNSSSDPGATNTPAPRATATATPKPTKKPTSTPRPTRNPTSTPRTSVTAKPTATATPKPSATATPRPTATLTPVPTPVPTETPTPIPEPTETPVPTPEPTEEPDPTDTPEPTPEPVEDPGSDGDADNGSED